MSQSSTANRPRPPRLQVGEIIILAAVALWGVIVIALGLALTTRSEFTALTVGLGAATLLVTALGLWKRWVIGGLLGAAALLGLACIGFAAADIARGGSGIALALGGVVVLVIVGAAAAIILQLRRTAAAPRAEAPSTSAAGEDLLRRIHEHSMLSDSAKRVLFREREIALLQNAIEHDIAQGQYGAALTMCDDIANLFGQRETAERFRMQIEAARREHREAEIDAALHRFEERLIHRDWRASHAEAARIKRLYPDAHQVHDIDQRIEAARDEHKRELEQAFLVAAQHEDVEEAMRLLKSLDRYLTPIEATRFQELAHGVVSKHRENLGVQFKLAVNDHRWHEAARVGQAIIDEFPNSKMSDEVRAMIDLIRHRATQAAVEAGG